jgi:hypothetical protein
MSGQPLDPKALRANIEATLKPLSLWTPDVEELLLATCANESNFGVYRTQGGGGPARGIFQMEGEDFNDIWTNYLQYHATLAFQIKNYNGGRQGTVDDMINNDQYAICMARVHYLRKPGAVPPANDIEQIWAYYKKWYNTPAGAATHDEFVAKYKKYVLGE